MLTESVSTAIRACNRIDLAWEKVSSLSRLPSILASFPLAIYLIKQRKEWKGAASSSTSSSTHLFNSTIGAWKSNSILLSGALIRRKAMFTCTPSVWFRNLVPTCVICFLYLCSFYLFICATNSLIYSTVCLLHANETFCAEIDRNKSLRLAQVAIQKESSQWSLYGTLSFSSTDLNHPWLREESRESHQLT